MKVQTLEGDVQNLDEKVFKHVSLLNNMFEGCFNKEDEPPIKLEKVSTNSLNFVIEYCNLENVDFKTSDINTLDSINAYENNEIDFIKKISMDSLLELTNTANFLEISRLTHLCCCQIAMNMKNFDIKEICKILQIPEESCDQNFGEAYWNEQYQKEGI